MIIKPFVKWAGGKGQLLSEIRKKYPTGSDNEITKFCEPFVGGGAVLFDVLSNCKFEQILINDINSELINAYEQIKKNIYALIMGLKIMQDDFIPLETEERKLYYYRKRERFNALKLGESESTNIEKAALFIFLNKTCFNGLFRVNKQGLFNVPMGAYKNPLICNEENLLNMHKGLQNVEIISGEYSECLDFIDENTFVYIDPPYRPLTVTSSFTSYAESGFNDNAQIELGKFVDKIAEKGAKVVVSNSDPKNIDENDEFFDDIYGKYTIERVNAKRMINCNAKSRGDVRELLISNF